MVDSTGTKEQKSISCANCERSIYFMQYTPERGHGGEELHMRGCIVRESADIQKATLHLIDVKNREIVSSKFYLETSIETYHYNGFEIPKFGFYPGEVMYLCAACCDLTPSAVATRRISRAIEELICKAVFLDGVEISFKRKSTKKKEILAESSNLLTLLKKLSRMDSRFGKNVLFKINKALKKLYPTQ